MVTVNLEDEHLVDNVKAIQELKDFGFSDAEIQKMYDRQLELDKKESESEE